MYIKNDKLYILCKECLVQFENNIEVVPRGIVCPSFFSPIIPAGGPLVSCDPLLHTFKPSLGRWLWRILTFCVYQPDKIHLNKLLEFSGQFSNGQKQSGQFLFPSRLSRLEKCLKSVRYLVVIFNNLLSGGLYFIVTLWLDSLFFFYCFGNGKKKISRS